MKILLKNTKRLVEDKLISCDVLIENGKIKEIGTSLIDNEARTIDCKNNLLVPGLIDLHIHLREPGGEHKETIITGTKSAARGGFTTVAAMPNTSPVPDNAEKLNDLFESIKRDAVVRVLPYASITKDLKGTEVTDIKALSEANAFAFTDDGIGIQISDVMLRAMKEAAKQDKAVVAHCEDNSLIYGGVIHEGNVSERLNLPGIPATCEAVQIARDVLLAEQANCHYHVCHVSTKESVRVIRDAKRAGIHVTAEVTPHHLILTEEDVLTEDTNFKMNPPLRSKEDHEALLTGLLDGTIDFIATDHAPHAEEEKALGMIKSPFGIVGLETAFPLLYTYLVKEGKMTLQQLVDFLTIIPAEVFKLPYGKIEVGACADLAVIDLNKEIKIDKESFHSKSKNTPFHNWAVQGIPVLTMVEGKIVFEEDIHAIHT